MKLVPVAILRELGQLKPQIVKFHESRLGLNKVLVIAIRFTPITGSAEHLQIGDVVTSSLCSRDDVVHLAFSINLS